MEQAITGIFTTSFLVYALVVAVIVASIRTVVEFGFKKLALVIPDKIEGILLDVWREWILRGLPIIVGGLLAYYVVQYPFPVEFAASVSGRVFFGLVAGLFSSTIYSFVKFHVRKYLPEEIKTKINELNPLSTTETNNDQA